MTQSIESLINQAKELITQIQSHPEVQQLEYSPDLNIADAKQALIELSWELNLITLEETE